MNTLPQLVKNVATSITIVILLTMNYRRVKKFLIELIFHTSKHAHNLDFCMLLKNYSYQNDFIFTFFFSAKLSVADLTNETCTKTTAVLLMYHIVWLYFNCVIYFLEEEEEGGYMKFYF